MSTIRVLVVDDHDLLREGVSACLDGFADIDVVGEAKKDVLFVTKNRSGSTCYAFVLEDLFGSDDDRPRTARRIHSMKIDGVTAMDSSPIKPELTILTKSGAFVFGLNPELGWGKTFAAPLKSHSTPQQKKGEALCYDTTGATWVLVGEGEHEPVWSVPVRQ